MTTKTSDELRLSILGMSCAGCVSVVEGALAAVDGVTAGQRQFCRSFRSG